MARYRPLRTKGPIGRGLRHTLTVEHIDYNEICTEQLTSFWMALLVGKGSQMIDGNRSFSL